MSSHFERFRHLFWALAVGVIGLYVFGLVLGVYSPLELGLLSAVCLALIVMFTIHELRLRRELREHPDRDHTDRERRGW